MKILPRVTVIIPNYNHARYLPERIESVINQTFSDIEIIILDDFSTDNSREVISSFAKKDNRIKFVFNEQNSGSTFKQWNKGLRLAKGQYIWIAESDDAADKMFLEKLLACFHRDLEIVLAYSNSFDIDSNSNIKGTIDWYLRELDSMWGEDFNVKGINLVRRYMPYRNIIPNASSAVFKLDTVNEVGGAEEGYRLYGDMVFWAKIMSKGNVAYLSEPLNYWRTHQNNVRTKTALDVAKLKEASIIMKAIQSHGELDQRNKDMFFDQFVNLWYDTWANQVYPLHANINVYNNIIDLYPTKKAKLFFILSKRFMNKASGLKALFKKSGLYKKDK